MQKLKGLIRKVLEGTIDEPDLLQYLVNVASNYLFLSLEYLGIFAQEIQQKNGRMTIPVDAERIFTGERDRMIHLARGDSDSQELKEVCVQLPGNDWGLAVFCRRRDGNEQVFHRFREIFRTTYLRYQMYHQGLKRWGTDLPLVIIGQSPLLIQAISRVEQYARTGYPVVIQGETGTGKELFARALHVLSSDTTNPFYAINCAHLQSNELVKSELFGHRKGSFTGAVTDREGAFLQANGGTLFLDEIETLTPEVQAMLLRVLEFEKVTPVGADRPIQVHVRLVAATNKDLENLVTTGQFREDFYYRLMVHHVHVPLLRDRGEADILSLANYFLQYENFKQPVNKVFTPDL